MKTNYEILGVPENTPVEVIEKKYGALVRQYRQRITENGATNEDIEYYKSITKAYNELTGRSNDIEDDNPNSIIPYKVRKKWGRFVSFLDNYKLLFLIAGLLIVCVVIYFVQRNVPDEDIYIKVVGAYTSSNIDQLCEQVGNKSEICEKPLVNFFTVTTETEYSSAKESEATQFQAQRWGGYIDIILIDKESYDVYVKDFSFMKLDGFIEEHKDDPAFSDLTYYVYESSGKDDVIEPESGIYGIDITNCSFFDDMNFFWLYNEEKGQKKTMILTIASKTKRAEMAKKMAEELISYSIIDAGQTS